jgi:two-component system sensor histidine kinase SenX3
MSAESKKIAINFSPLQSTQVLGDRNQVVMAIHNLVENAINYSPESTRVAVTLKEESGLVEVSVSDQGIGIPEKDLERIFERFYRVDAARSRETGGTGLGLSIVKHVATNHGGDVSVWSVEGAGSTFTIRFPQANSHNRMTNGGAS